MSREFNPKRITTYFIKIGDEWIEILDEGKSETTMS